MKRRLRDNPWLVVLGCALALSTSSTAMVNLCFSLFIQPIASETGWTRSLISAGFSAFSIAMAFALPFTGRILDRVNTRIALPIGVFLFAVSIALIGLTPLFPLAFVGLFFIAGMFGAAHSPLPYTIVISRWFDARRGTAIGLALTGSGIGAIFMPRLVNMLIEQLGWRMACVGLACLILLIAIPAIMLLVSTPPGAGAVTRGPDRKIAADVPGIEPREALRRYAFWAIALSAILVALTASGTLAHIVPLLVAEGFSAAKAASMLSVVGMAILFGRLSAGYVLDRIFAPYVAIATMGILLVGMGLLWSGLPYPAPLIALLCLGLCFGAEFDIFGYMVSRYFGLRRFGEIFGYLGGAFAVASAVGPICMGASFDLLGSYEMALLCFAAVLPLGMMLLYRMEAYPFPVDRNARAGS